MWGWAAYEGASYAKSGQVLGIFPGSPWAWLYVVDIVLSVVIGLCWIVFRSHIRQQKVDNITYRLANNLDLFMGDKDNQSKYTDSSGGASQPAGVDWPNVEGETVNQEKPHLETTIFQDSSVRDVPKMTDFVQLPQRPFLSNVTYDWVLGGFRRDPSTITHEPTDFERHILEEEKTPLDPPPTPQEIHEAEMNPWPGHTMRETILRNRGILSNEPPSMPILQQQVAVPANQEPQPPYVSQQQDDPIANIDQSPPAVGSDPPPTSYSEQLPPEQTQPEDHPAESDQQ